MEVTKQGAVSVIGGGDTATACKVYDTVDKAGWTWWELVLVVVFALVVFDTKTIV